MNVLVTGGFVLSSAVTVTWKSCHAGRSGDNTPDSSPRISVRPLPAADEDTPKVSSGGAPVTLTTSSWVVFHWVTTMRTVMLRPGTYGEPPVILIVGGLFSGVGPGVGPSQPPPSVSTLPQSRPWRSVPHDSGALRQPL